jgi:hypothetical protein
MPLKPSKEGLEAKEPKEWTREKPNTLKVSVYTPGLSRTARSHASVRAGSGQGTTGFWISLIQRDGQREIRRKESRTKTE